MFAGIRPPLSGSSWCPDASSRSAPASQLKASMKKAAGLHHDHTGSAPARMAIGQPKELRAFRFLGHAASICRELCPLNPVDEAPVHRWSWKRRNSSSSNERRDESAGSETLFRWLRSGPSPMISPLRRSSPQRHQSVSRHFEFRGGLLRRGGSVRPLVLGVGKRGVNSLHRHCLPLAKSLLQVREPEASKTKRHAAGSRVVAALSRSSRARDHSFDYSAHQDSDQITELNGAPRYRYIEDD
jgi:hypothetical protein